MIKTYNISLSAQLAKSVDQTVKAEGFSSRSELIRTALRLYLKLSESQPSSLEPYSPTPTTTLKRDLTQSGKYSEAFIDSVIKGLKKSSTHEDSSTQT